MDTGQAKEFRGLAARLNYMSQHCPDLQFPIKQASRELANPTMGSLAAVKKVARCLLDRAGTVWTFKWQDEPDQAYLTTDSDWGGSVKDRRSTSGGAFMLGHHCIKTWSCTQGAYALSSAEAELYGTVEGVIRAKGLVSLAKEIGFLDLSLVIRMGVDSNAAKQFVARRGLGRMRHLDVKNLWLQKDVRDGLLEVIKIPGTENPADLMTKILTSKEIEDRLEMMNIGVRYSPAYLGRHLQDVSKTRSLALDGSAGNHVRRLMGWAKLGKDGADELDYYKSLAQLYEDRLRSFAGRVQVSAQRDRPTNPWPSFGREQAA